MGEYRRGRRDIDRFKKIWENQFIGNDRLEICDKKNNKEVEERGNIILPQKQQQ